MLKPLVIACTVLTVSIPAVAVTVDVDIHHFAFDPPTVQISVGDAVRWTNMDFIIHTATGQTGPGTLIPSGAFDSGDLKFGQSFQFTFNTPGVYHYYCVPHGSSMQGVITISAPPAPCPGDANADRAINGADLSVLLAQFATTVVPGSGADFNKDGVVNGADLSVLLAAFGTSCP